MAFEPAQHSFITLEGVDGAGKSTQARLLARALELAGYQVVSLREPGGTAISEKIRALLLDPANTAMGDTCELLLYEAARAQLVHEVIAPALAAGKVVLCDRFYDSTTCYQAFADGLDRQMVRDANNLAVAGTHPALTLVYHITPEQAALRMAARGAADRMEAKGMTFQERVYQGFCAIAAEEPNRVKLIDATATVEEVFEKTVEQIRAYGLDIPQDAVTAALAQEAEEHGPRSGKPAGQARHPRARARLFDQCRRQRSRIARLPVFGRARRGQARRRVGARPSLPVRAGWLRLMR